MKNRILFLALLICGLCVAAFAQSQPPEQKAHSDESKPGILQRGTEDSPLIVKVVALPEQQPASTTSEKSTDKKYSLEIVALVIAGLGALSAFIQAISNGSQRRIMRDTLDVTKVTADAAKESAGAAKATVEKMEEIAYRQLRAYVSIGIKSISRFNTARQAGFKFECVNHGQTPARDVEYRGVVGLLEATNALQAFPEIEQGWNPKAFNLFPAVDGTR